MIEGDVDAVLDVYFRQCAILVDARDLAIMGATLANHGVNPVTGDIVASPHVVARTLSVMTSSGMYDYAGEWIYRVGIPAKSGVGGGIVAALPAQVGMGTFSPLLDSHGNSVRGLKVCEALSSHFDLHMLNRSADVRTSVIADYETSGFATRRNRAPHERRIIEDRRHDIRVVELVGALSFATIDYVTRQLAAKPPAASLLIIECRRVPDITEAGARLLGEHFGRLGETGTTVIIAGVEAASRVYAAICNFAPAARLRRFDLLDEAIEWAEDQIIYRYGGFSGQPDAAGLAEQPLLAGLSKKDIAALTALSVARRFEAGTRIVSSGEPAASVYFLESGIVSVKMPSGVRLASFGPGASFGEMAMIEPHRSADVIADTAIKCLELPLDALGEKGGLGHRVATQILRNLAALLARRLILANAKVDLLSGFTG